MKNKDLKLSLLFTVIGMVAGAVTSLYQYRVIDEATKTAIISQLGSINMLFIVSAAQSGIIAFVCSIIGLKLARKINLQLNFKFNKNSFLTALIIGFLTAFIISGSDKFIFASYLPSGMQQPYNFNIAYFLSSILYGGIIEEVMMRLFLMSLIVFILMKLLKSNKDNIPSWIFVVAIILSALLFAAGHLPAASQMFGLSVPMVTRILLLNAIGGLGFGFLYWKHGLSYSMVAHLMTHVFNQLLLFPLFFK